MFPRKGFWLLNAGCYHFQVISEYIICNPIRLQFVDLCILWNSTGGLCPWCSNTIGCMSFLKMEESVDFLFLKVISKMVLLFSIPSIVDFHTEWRILTRSLSFGCYLSRLPIYYLLVSLLRQDCRRVWAPPECLELWTKLEETQGFVICYSDIIPQDTMI